MKIPFSKGISLLLAAILAFSSIEVTALADTVYSDEAEVVVDSVSDNEASEVVLDEESYILEDEEDELEAAGDVVTVPKDKIITYPTYYKENIDGKEVYRINFYAIVDFEVTRDSEGGHGFAVGELRECTVGDIDCVEVINDYYPDVYCNFFRKWHEDTYRTEYYDVCALSAELTVDAAEIDKLSGDVPLAATIRVIDGYNSENVTDFAIDTNLKFASAPTNNTIEMPAPNHVTEGKYSYTHLSAPADIKAITLVGKNKEYKLDQDVLDHINDTYTSSSSALYPDFYLYDETYDAEACCEVSGKNNSYDLSFKVPIMDSGLYDLKYTTVDNKTYTYKNYFYVQPAAEYPSERVAVQPEYFKSSDGKYTVFFFLGPEVGSADLYINDTYVSCHCTAVYDGNGNVIAKKLYQYNVDMAAGEYPFSIVARGSRDDDCSIAKGNIKLSSKGIAITESTAWRPTYVLNEKTDYYASFEGSLGKGETVDKLQFVSVDDDGLQYDATYLKIGLMNDSVKTVYPSEYTYAINFDGEDIEIPESYREYITTSIKYIHGYYRAPVSQMKNGMYNMVYTTSKGKKITVKDAVSINNGVPVVLSVRTAAPGYYNCDLGSGYVAMVVYGQGLSDDLTPKFYGDENFTELFGEYDPEDPNCAVSPDLGDGRIYKIRVSEEMQSVSSKDLYVTLSDDTVYANGEITSDDKKGGSAYYYRNDIYRVVFSNTDTLKVLKAYISAKQVEEYGAQVGNGYTVMVTSYYPEYKNYNGTATLKQDQRSGEYYFEIDPTSTVFRKFYDYQYGNIYVNGQDIPVMIVNRDGIKSMSNLTVSGKDWVIRSASDMSVILANGAAGANVLSAAQLNVLSKEASVVVELYKGNQLSSVYEARFTSKAFDSITYQDDGAYEEECNPEVINKGQKITLKTPSREHYTFAGWYTDKKYTNRVKEITGVGGTKVTLYAKWTPKEYPITFTSGQETKEIKVKYGKEFKLTNPGFEKKGYALVAWADHNGVPFTESLDDSYDLETLWEILGSEDYTVTMEAIWEIENYSIDYHLNGADVDVSGYASQYTVEDSDIYLPVLSDIDGFEFVGWYTEDSFVKKMECIEAGSVGNIDLYAKWTPMTVVVRYHDNVEGGQFGSILKETSGTTIADESRQYGEIFTLKTNTYKVAALDSESNPGKYSFVGWATDPMGSVAYLDKGKVSFMPEDTNGEYVDLYAIYQNEFTIEYLNIDSATMPDDTQYSYTAGIGYTYPIPSQKGYEFLGWYDAKGNRVSDILKTTKGDQVVSARWKENQYKIVLDKNGGSGKDKTISVAYTKRVDLSKYTDIYTKKGYKFSGWEITLDGMGYYISNDFSPSDFSADFGANGSKIKLKELWIPCEYTMILHLNNGSGNVETTYTYSEEYVLLPGIISDSLTFAGWYKDKELTKPAGEYDEENGVVNIRKLIGDKNGEIHLYAKWKGNYKVILHQDPYGGMEHKDVSGFVNLTEKRLPANPYANGSYVFRGWDTQVGGLNVVYKDKAYIKTDSAICKQDGELVLNLYPVWTPAHLTFVSDVKDTESNTVSEYLGERAYSFDELTELYTPEKAGYEFVGWYKDKAYLKKASVKASEVKDMTFYAKWKPVKYTIRYHAIYSGNESDYEGAMDSQPMTNNTAEKLTKNKFKSANGSEYFVGWEATNGIENYTFKNGEKVKELPESAAIYLVSENGKNYLDLYGVWSDLCTFDLDLNTTDMSADCIYTSLSYLYEYGRVLEEDEVATREGYDFLGWYKEKSGITKLTSIAPKVAFNGTVYAKWKAKKYTIRYHANTPGALTASGSMSDQTMTFDKNTALKSNAFKASGCTFKGWAMDPEADASNIDFKNKQKIKGLVAENGMLTYPEDGVIDLYAVWDVANYKITYKNMDGFVNPNPDVYTSTYGLMLEEPVKLGYTFHGFYSDKEMTKRVTSYKVGTTGNKTLYAKWELVK